MVNILMQDFKKNGFVVIRKVISSKRCEEMYRTALQQINNPTEPYELESSFSYPDAPLLNSREGKLTVLSGCLPSIMYNVLNRAQGAKT